MQTVISWAATIPAASTWRTVDTTVYNSQTYNAGTAEDYVSEVTGYRTLNTG